MRKEANIYKVMLALKEEHRREINLLNRYEDIVSAKTETFLTLNQAVDELNKLRGMNDLKNEIARIIVLHDKLKREDRTQEIRRFFPYHYIFTSMP